ANLTIERRPLLAAFLPALFEGGCNWLELGGAWRCSRTFREAFRPQQVSDCLTVQPSPTSDLPVRPPRLLQLLDRFVACQSLFRSRLAQFVGFFIVSDPAIRQRLHQPFGLQHLLSLITRADLTSGLAQDRLPAHQCSLDRCLEVLY